MSIKNKKTILLVEDEAILAMSEKMTLEEYSYSVITVTTGEEAIETVKATPEIDLILMDIDLGQGLDGTQAAEIILKDHDIPVIFVSSHTEPEIVEKTEKITSYGYVVKSSSITVLDASIKMAFKLFNANQKIVVSDVYQKTMITNISDVIAIIGTDGLIKYQSPNIEKWFGWQPQDLLGTDGWLTVHPADLEHIQKVFYKLLEIDNSSITVEYLNKCKDGSYKPIELTGINLTNNPAIDGVLLNYRDISERTQAEEALINRDNFLDCIIDQSPFATWISDSKGIMQRANPALKKMLNLTDEQLVGKYNVLEDTIAGRNGLLPLIRTVFEEGKTITCTLEWDGNDMPSMDFKGSKSVICEATMFPIYNAEGILINVVCQWINITESKQAEDALRESEERFRRLTENAKDMIYRMSLPEGYYEYVSPSSINVFGYTPDEFIDSPLLIKNAIHPDWRNYFDDEWKALLSGNMPPTYEYQIVHGKTKEIRWLHQRNVFISNDKKQPVAIEGTVTDITDRKQAEEEIKRQLSEKETLLKEVHHRIKNNIASIEGILSMQLNSISNPEAVSALQDAITRVKGMRILYDKLLLSNDYQEVSIKDYIETLIDAIVTVFPESENVTIEKQIVDFDLNTKLLIPIGIIVNELFTNIFKYAFKGNDSGHISIILEKTGNHVILILQDNGNGIDERDDLNKSTGFGLTIVKMLAEQLGGTFMIENDNGIRNVLKFDI